MSNDPASASDHPPIGVGAASLAPMLNELAERLTDGVCIFDGQGEITYANTALGKMVGYEAAEMVGMNLLDLISQSDVLRPSSFIQRVLKGVPAEHDCLWISKEGSELWTRCNTVPLFASNGDYQGTVATVQNITERRSQEEAKAQLAAIVESSDDIIVSKDLSGRIKFWNKTAERILGYSSEEMVGQSIYKIIPPDRHREEDETLAKLARGERIEHFKTVRIAKDGHLVYVSLTISPVRGEGGEIIGASKVGRDITEEIKQEELRSRLAAIVESTDDAIVSKDLDGIVQTWNKGAERIFGYTAEEMIGQPVHKLLPEDRRGEENLILDRLRKGQKIDHYETQRKRKDGTLVDVAVTVSPIRSMDGRVIGASKVARDISGSKQAQAALQKSEESLRALASELETRVLERTRELEAANKEMEGFTYSVSHDLRAPLRAIVSSSMILKEDFTTHLPPDAVELLERQASAAQRLAKLIDDLLRLSRVSRADMKFQIVDVSQLAGDIADSLLQRNPDSRVEFAVQPKMVALADPQLLKLALENLMDNAQKFSPDGGVVSVGATELDGETVFYVKDHGIGFDAKYSGKLFLPFERLVRDEDFPGTGIGLANVKRIVERHSGRIWAEGSVGKGATFFFTLATAPVN
jgi:PAS domain S-box-containing protein